MFHTIYMKQHMVVTNVRMPQTEWIQIKVAAAGVGMSINEYLRYTAQTVSTYKQLFGKPQKADDKYAAMWAIVKKKTKGKPMGWSKEDEAIYSV